MPSPRLVKPAKSEEANVLLLDEIKSVRDVLEGIEKKLFWLEYLPKSSDIEIIKSELRPVRNDTAAPQKRLPAAEEPTPAT